MTGRDELETDERALALRTQGKTYAEIARVLDLPKAIDANRAFNRALRRHLPAEMVRLRAVETERLDRMERAVKMQAQLVPAEVDRRVRGIQRQRDRLFDEPRHPRRVPLLLSHLPAELRSRAEAATGNAQVRVVSRRQHGTDSSYDVWAIAGDRVVLMRLAVRHDGSVAEDTTSFLRRDVTDVIDAGADDAVLVVAPDDRRYPITRDFAAEVNQAG